MPSFCGFDKSFEKNFKKSLTYEPIAVIIMYREEMTSFFYVYKMSFFRSNKRQSTEV